MEGKIIELPSFTPTIERLVQNPANCVLNFSLEKISSPIQKEWYFKAVKRSYLSLKFHLYDIYRTLLHGENVSNIQDELYIEVLNKISRQVLSKSIISCRKIGEKYYSVRPDPIMVKAYYQEFNVISKRIRLPKKEDHSYRNIIQEAVLQGHITNNDAEYLDHILQCIVSGVHLIWQILQKMFQEYSTEGILPIIYDNQQFFEENAPHFDMNLAYIEKIYNFLVDDTFPNTISKTAFITCVHSANFSAIWTISDIKKAKLKYAIYCIGKQMSDGWYQQVANSIGSKPQQCSKGNVPIDWKNRIECIKS